MVNIYKRHKGLILLLRKKKAEKKDTKAESLLCFSR